MQPFLTRLARHTCAGLLLWAAIQPVARADDLDIFMGTTGSGAVPNVMFMVDNSANWSRQAQQWPGGTQGQSEMQALLNLLGNGDMDDARVGLAGYTGSGSSVGGYVRFGMRDMSVAANKTALTGILTHIRDNVGGSVEKVNDPGEAPALYEVYKYFARLAPFRGSQVSGNNPAANVDVNNNSGNPQNRNPTAFSRGLTSGFAIGSNNLYSGLPTDSCGQSHLIFIVNNAQGQIPTGSQSFEGVSAGDALPVIPGVSDVSWTDEWARFLYQHGVTVHILDAYNAQQNRSHSAVLLRAATVAGGNYYAVKNQSQIELAVKKILASIRASNSNFAAASLPISATNRSQSLNQVFIGMFRPNLGPDPRWVGNLKQYQLIRTATDTIDLGDMRPAVNGFRPTAINLQTGFVSECAVSFWTTDSPDYWQTTRGNTLTNAGCTVYPTVNGVLGSQWSDMPDGPIVEKGGVSEVVRKGNNPPTTNTTPTWSVNRNIYTYSATTTNKLQTLTTGNTSWSQQLFDWVRGFDDATAVTVDGVTSRPFSDFTNTSTTARTRPSIHGDVVHSRPLPVNYGGNNVTVYYGSNDGMLRAVDATNGRERWAFVAPEHFGKFQRLHDNAPPIAFPHVDAALNPKPKDYFFDGSFGLFQNGDNSKIWIFASMRRGGRMLYAFDVTDPDAPKLKWKVGGPNMSDDTGCTTGFANMGQTWSLPSVAFLKGYSTTTPVIIVGGGYSACEDTDSASPSCSARKGGSVFVIDADTGALVREFAPASAGSFAADLSLSDSNHDGSVDFAYGVTTTGEIYRVDFSDAGMQPAASGTWAARKVAAISGGRKFLYPPALLRSGGKMYVAVGSGDREHPVSSQYPYASSIRNRFYMYVDDLAVPASSTAAVAVAMDTDPAVRNFSSATSCSTEFVTPGSSLKGWFMDLPGRGEQTITSALIAGGMVTFNTNRATPGGTNACTNPLGESRGYWVNLLNASGAIGVAGATCGGDRSSVFVGGGLTPSPTLATVVVDGTTETVAIGAAQRSGGASSGIAPQQVKPAITSARKTIFWKSNTVD
jgi:type IV pilus assembly protein PilY1